MVFTGDVHYGWREFRSVRGRNTFDGTGRYVDEVVIELVKGQRHIEAVGQHGIDPEIVLMRAISAALLDDLREAEQAKDLRKINTIRKQYYTHEMRRELKENSWIAHRTGAVLRADLITTGAKGDQ